MRVEVKGIKRLEKALKAHYHELGDAFEQSLYDAARLLRYEAVEKAPIDTGALKASGDYFIEGSGFRAVAYIGFGFPVAGFFKGNRERIPADYAVWQHDAPYERKYLEEAVDENYGELNYIIYVALAGV